MTVYHDLIFALWLIFVAYWAVSAMGAKRTAGGWAWRREIGLRLALALCVVVALRIPAVRSALREAWFAAGETSPPVNLAGVVLCAFGVGLAIVARTYLGRNWGMPMSRKENPELVTNGPYAVVRHPIYTGILLAMLGSAMGDGVFWLVPFVLGGAYFLYSARREEKLMIAQFPERYPAYKKRTKMLLPFVL
ncbi:MAG: isoprenylcysteine carboxylmethyltransferase family protein [Alphaproteobacteria bacterium]|nr:isoprenylcysteine carboxylmethyltransferase family protein [Alphaproteobacteria bacterium]